MEGFRLAPPWMRSFGDPIAFFSGMDIGWREENAPKKAGSD
jgi:hypothetical protein